MTKMKHYAPLALLVICVVASCGKDDKKPDDPSDTTSFTGWPSTDTSTADTNTTDTGTGTTSPTDTGTGTGTVTGTDTQTTDTQTTTETDPGFCVNPLTDCPTSVALCEAYACVEGACVLGDAMDGLECHDPVNDCLRGNCIAGECAEMGAVSGVPCLSDGNDCTSDLCMSGECEHPATPGIACVDDNDCTQNVCAANGTCGVPANGAICAFDTDPCTEDKCQGGACIGEAIDEGESCDDGLWCNGTAVCHLGACTPAPPPCGEGTECAYFACVEPVGGAEIGTCGAFVELENGAPCDDDDFCNGPDACQEGECEHGPLPCTGETGDPCTAIACDSVAQECVEDDEPNDTPCPNELLCDGTERCMDGACETGVDYCTIVNSCQSRTCDENGGSPICGDPIFANNGQVCSTTDICDGSGTQRCVEGVCARGETPACQPAQHDGNLCTRYAACSVSGDQTICQMLWTNDDTESINDYKFPPIGGSGEWSVDFGTAQTNNDVETYGAACPGTFTGGEITYLLNVNSGTTYDVTIVTDGSVDGSDLRLFIVRDACSPATSCVGSSTTHVQFTATSNTYYAVIDGVDGNRGIGTIALEEL